MSHLNKKTIQTLTRLSRIGCSPEEEKSLLEDLEKILAYVDQLNEVNTDAVEPCYQVIQDMTALMREDTVGETLSRERFLSNVPSQIGGLVRIPTVLKAPV